MGNRKAATAELLKMIDRLLPGSENATLYKDRLATMTDDDFEAFIGRLETGEEILSLIAPNLSEHKLSLENNLALAKEWKHEFFEQLWLTDPTTGVVYLTPVKYLVVDLPVRRQQQLLFEKMSIPKDNRRVDENTGQPAGDSHGASLSFPEVQTLYAQGIDQSIEELFKFRGGDIKGMQAMNRQVIETGSVSLASLRRVRTVVKSTETLSTLLKAMHLDNNLVK